MPPRKLRHITTRFATSHFGKLSTEKHCSRNNTKDINILLTVQTNFRFSRTQQSQRYKMMFTKSKAEEKTETTKSNRSQQSNDGSNAQQGYQLRTEMKRDLVVQNVEIDTPIGLELNYSFGDFLDPTLRFLEPKKQLFGKCIQRRCVVLVLLQSVTLGLTNEWWNYIAIVSELFYRAAILTNPFCRYTFFGELVVTWFPVSKLF